MALFNANQPVITTIDDNDDEIAKTHYFLHLQPDYGCPRAPKCSQFCFYAKILLFSFPSGYNRSA